MALTDSDKREFQRMTKAQLLDMLEWYESEKDKSDKEIKSLRQEVFDLKHAAEEQSDKHRKAVNQRWNGRKAADRLDSQLIDQVLRNHRRGDSWRKLGEIYGVNYNTLRRVAMAREEHYMQYGHINTGESSLAYGETNQTIKADLAARPELVELIARHRKSCQWTQGEPVEVFTDEGFPCIRYAGGNWWHYDTNKGTWF